MYMLASEFREKLFYSDSKPSVQSIKNSIKRGEIKGLKLGGSYYVNVDEEYKETKHKIEEEIKPNFSRYLKKENNNA